MFYGCGLCLHTCWYMSLAKCIEYVIWLWYVSTYMRMYAYLHSCLYILWLWYVSTHLPIYVSLHTCLVWFMDVASFYIHADICLSRKVLSMLYSCCMCVHTCRYMPLYIRVWYGKWQWWVPLYVRIYASLRLFGMLYGCGICQRTS